MEANEITDGPQATEDAEERPSLKDPSEDLREEPTSPEISLDLSSLQTSLQLPASDTLFVTPASPNPETGASESLVEPPDSETRLKPHTTEILSTPSQVSLRAPASETLSKSPQSVSSLEKAIAEIPLESLTDEIRSTKVKKKSLQLSPAVNPPASPHKLSTAEGPEAQVPGSEHIPKHSFSGPSSQATADTEPEPSAKQEEVRDEEPIVGTSTVSTPAAKPEPRVSKKEKRVSGYPSRPVVPAKRAELVEMAKAMHREHFGTQVEYLFQWEKDSALKAIQTGLYIGWRCPHYLWDCFRIGDESRCFCGHLLREHQIISDLSVPCSVSQCRCLMFCFIPSRPEEVGEFWLKRRATFDPKAWRAQCRCKHTHEDHAATGAHPCRHRGCCCSSFESNFLCAACDRRWEEHETFFETEETRRRGGRPYGADTVNNWHRPF
uniref:protein FAM221B isoform X2 n=1 Tax=Myodes glareolus TaxID=447135 RepID=UPI00202027D1|nr:protein FAM221B isoform X2 [Myodes glareolus]